MRPRKKSGSRWYWVLAVSVALFLGWLWYAQRTRPPTRQIQPDRAQRSPARPDSGKVARANAARPLAPRSSAVQSRVETNTGDFSSRSAQVVDSNSTPSAVQPSITLPADASTGANQTNTTAVRSPK